MFGIDGILFVSVRDFAPTIEQVSIARDVACIFLRREMSGDAAFTFGDYGGTLHHIRTTFWGNRAGDFFRIDFGFGQAFEFFVPRGVEDQEINVAVMLIPIPAEPDLIAASANLENFGWDTTKRPTHGEGHA